MTEQTAGTATDAPGPPVHKFWWLHDARWYQGVLKRYGKDAANEINAEAIHFVARRVARWYGNIHGLDFDAMSTEEIVTWFPAIRRILWTDEMTQGVDTALGDDEFETVIHKHFALTMLRAAGSLDEYECPCLDMRAGIFEGMGIDVADRRLGCQRAGDETCHFRAVRRGGGACHSDHSPGTPGAAPGPAPRGQTRKEPT